MYRSNVAVTIDSCCTSPARYVMFQATRSFRPKDMAQWFLMQDGNRPRSDYGFWDMYYMPFLLEILYHVCRTRPKSGFRVHCAMYCQLRERKGKCPFRYTVVSHKGFGQPQIWTSSFEICGTGPGFNVGRSKSGIHSLQSPMWIDVTVREVQA